MSSARSTRTLIAKDMKSIANQIGLGETPKSSAVALCKFASSLTSALLQEPSLSLLQNYLDSSRSNVFQSLQMTRTPKG